MNTFHIAFMQHHDIPEAAHVLSIAMLDNPNHIGIFMGHGEKERLAIERMFLDLLHTVPGIVFLARQHDAVVGVMRMKSCCGKTVAEPAPVADEHDLEWRKSVWFREWAGHDPKEQHWHLGPIGVFPSHWGKGVGSALMRRFCAEVDACAEKAYLETDKAGNVRFYEKFGFKRVAGSDIFGVANTYMIRDAQLPANPAA